MKKTTLLYFLALILSSGVIAQPTTITWQGKLLDNNGNAITQNNVAMTFVMFDASNGGSQLWPASGVATKTVNVVQGLYSVQLGTGVGDDIAFTATMFNGKTPWLEVKVGTETLPRTEVTNVPFSLISNELGASGWENPGELGKTTPNTGKFTSVETGSVKITTGASGGKVLTSDAVGNATWQNTTLANFEESNYTYNSKTGVKLLATHSEPFVDVVISPKGAGGILARQPNGTSLGGNNRGQSVVDLQLYGNDASQVASGNFSVIPGGVGNTASGSTSFAFGQFSTASGDFSTALGHNSNATGKYSFSHGKENTAQSYCETVFGLYGTVGAGTASSFVSTDRLFVVGNGTADGSRSNALSILKNANTTIGGSLSINGNGTNTSITFPTTRGTNGQVLTSNGSGGINWAISAVGTITDVTGTAPIISSGGTTPAISISAATTSAAGSMSAADKTKLDAITGTNTGNQTITLTGDVTGLGTGSFAATISLASVTNAKMATMAANTIKVNNTASAAAPTDLSLTANTFPSRKSAGNITAYNITDFAFDMLNDADAAAVRTTIGAGTGNGTVTGVTGTAPIVSSGGNTPVISISAVTTLLAGSMSAADKTKLDGIAANANNYTHPTGDGNLHVPATSTSNNGKVLTAGSTAGSLSWTTLPTAPVTSVAGKTGVVTLVKADVGLGNVENTALSTWTGSSSITTLGTIATGTWNGTAIAENWIGNLSASKITSGTFHNDRINWASPGNIGSGVPAQGRFTSLFASEGLGITNGDIILAPFGNDGNSGDVLTNHGNGSARWEKSSVWEAADEFTANASQTVFMLTQMPAAKSKVKLFINGVRISKTAFTCSGTTFTYNPANNGNYNLTAGDRIQIDYYY